MQYMMPHRGNLVLNTKHSCIRLMIEFCFEFTKYNVIKSINLQWTNLPGFLISHTIIYFL
jgi:hypothetical protein